MKKILILGTGPLPIENDSYSYGSSNRTWHFAKGLLEKGHRVHAVAFRPMRTRDGKVVPDQEQRSFRQGDFTLDSVDAVLHFYSNAFLEKQVEAFCPDAIIGVNVFPASRACHLRTPLPIWADLNGFNMGEVQIRARVTANQEAVAQGWAQELPALRRADIFSAASWPQRYAVIGELAAIGRLCGKTCGYEFVHVIPNGREDFPPLEGAAPLRAQLGQEAILALWVGCYNYQFDTETLLQGVLDAMDRVPHLHFVSTGGRVEGHDEITFTRFHERAMASSHRERFHFTGWLPQEEFERLLRSCDFGLTADRACYETELGARNRLTEMLRAGLPALATAGPEIALDLREHDAGWTIPVGAVSALTDTLVEICQTREGILAKGANARRLFQAKYTLEATLAPLLAWVENPQVAPDHGRYPLLLPPLEPARNSVWKQALDKLFGKA